MYFDQRLGCAAPKRWLKYEKYASSINIDRQEGERERERVREKERGRNVQMKEDDVVMAK